MRDANVIVRERQQDVRRAMDADDISLKSAAGKAGMPVSTFTSYFHGEKNREPATLNVAGLYKLVKGDALPLSMLSMLLPNGFQIVRAPEEIDHDEIERLCREYLETKGRAHRKNSPGGTEVTEDERETLNGCALRLVGGIAA